MRGKPPTLGPARWPTRIIPAHAGQTCFCALCSWPRADHPRACGANPGRVLCSALLCGSSPRMRGKLRLRLTPTTAARIIPAHAGQTYRHLKKFLTYPDHPRACGANCPRSTASRWVFGSSPRMRGKPWLGWDSPTMLRIIPAHAGQTPHTHRASSPPTDHPRACGANPRRVAKTADTPGSSPRMRGKRAD